MSILLLLQAATDVAPSSIPQMLVPGGTATALLYFWRQDRKDREEERKREREQVQALAMDFRSMVQENTTAIVQNTALIGRLTERLEMIAGRDSRETATPR